MVFKSMSKGFTRGVVAVILCCGTLLMAGEPARAEGAGMFSGESSFAEVRVDLQAGTFLDPLPFDQAFLIVGRVPVATEAVEVRLSEFLEAPVVLSEQELQQFESKLRIYLAAATARDSLETTASSLDTQRLRRKVNALLIEQVQAEGALRPLRQIWHYATPWNWENWGDLFRGRSQAVVAPGTIFDLSEGGVDTQELETRLATTSSLIEFIVREAHSAQVVTFSPSRPSRPPVRWNRLSEAGGGGERKSASEAEPLGSWNRLEQIRTLTGRPDEDLFSGSGRAQQGGGKVGGWVSFRVLVQPLEAERYYRFDFLLERKLAQTELDAFVTEAQRRGDEVLGKVDRGSIFPPDGQHLLAALTESLQGVVGSDWLKEGGTVFDRESPYSSPHGEMTRLAEDWKAAAEDEEAGELLESKLEDMVRQQKLVRETSIGAPTADNDYVSGDIGLIYAPRIGEPAVYIGANFYLRPVNKGVPLSQKGGWLRRFAFSAGLTLNSIEDRRGIRSDLFFNQALVLGAGYRISQYWRVGGGSLVFRERDPDSYPLTSKKRTALTPYVGLTFDADTGQQLKGIGGLFDFLKGGR
jgi:hypothetical protein